MLLALVAYLAGIVTGVVAFSAFIFVKEVAKGEEDAEELTTRRVLELVRSLDDGTACDPIPVPDVSRASAHRKNASGLRPNAAFVSAMARGDQRVREQSRHTTNTNAAQRTGPDTETADLDRA
jgi:hypothetical protein